MKSQNQWRNENLFDNREEELEAYSAFLLQYTKRGLKIKRYPTKANKKIQKRAKTATDGADSVIVEKILKSTEEEDCAQPWTKMPLNNSVTA